jgi:DNA primase
MTKKQKIDRSVMGHTFLTVIQTTVDLEFKTGRWWGLCPFHAEKTPSFMVDSQEGIFYCFGCQKGGDLVDFIRMLADRETAKVREAEWRERN